MVFIQWRFKPRLNKVKASGGCLRFSEEIYREELEKIWAQIRQGAFDIWNVVQKRLIYICDFFVEKGVIDHSDAVVTTAI
ncbi:hypothetical protein J22TS1_40690 [Siminovitchia terrae]|uniref:hypothetical protein n=1 Tax=Siminovitchia terrae TaxID=1914933 RepID=UPI001B2B3C38|nr:hypothetical protein [Siminovitchia terrae]GIN93018.1 hypothetical protein J22TS1_40690 [Siminovitchia terrae]